MVKLLSNNYKFHSGPIRKFTNPDKHEQIGKKPETSTVPDSTAPSLRHRIAEGANRTWLRNRLWEKTQKADASMASQTEPPATVKITMAGGTFASVGAGSDTTYGIDPNTPFDHHEKAFLNAVGPQPGIRFIFEKKPPYFKDSIEVGPDDLLRSVQQGASSEDANNEEAGNVETHGTDSEVLAALAKKLAGIDCIFAGAMKPSDSPQADGPQNAKNAVLLAASKDPRLKGTLITMNEGDIFDPVTAEKSHPTSSKEAFRAANGRRIGTIKNGQITVEARPSVLPFTFNLNGVSKLPSVVVHTCSPLVSLTRQLQEIEARLKLDTASEIVDRENCGGYQKVLIVESFASGIMSDDLQSKLAKFQEQGVFVFRTNEIPDGAIADQPTDEEYKIINGGVLSANKLGLFVQFYLAAMRQQGKEVSYEMMKDAVQSMRNALEPTQPDVSSIDTSTEPHGS